MDPLLLLGDLPANPCDRLGAVNVRGCGGGRVVILVAWMTAQSSRCINLRFVKFPRGQRLVAVARLHRPGFIDSTNDVFSIVQANGRHIRDAGCAKGASNGGSGQDAGNRDSEKYTHDEFSHEARQSALKLILCRDSLTDAELMRANRRMIDAIK
ncbi:hypothetical protein [Paraburkholderia fungorum]|jgi:hypothetical protein|nr:hypothetical protein [Paraburkholderia fungorum]